jgi:Holliday junction resolvase-like predicted endonuclease
MKEIDQVLRSKELELSQVEIEVQSDWRKLYEAAMLEMNPDKLATLVQMAEQAIAQQESNPDVTQLERRKLTDARLILKTLSRIASSQGKRATHGAAQQPEQQG